MLGHANFILPNGTWLGVNDSSKALGFVVLSPVATLSWEIHTTAELHTLGAYVSLSFILRHMFVNLFIVSNHVHVCLQDLFFT